MSFVSIYSKSTTIFVYGNWEMWIAWKNYSHVFLSSFFSYSLKSSVLSTEFHPDSRRRLTGLSLKILNCFSWPRLWHHSLKNPQLLNVQNFIKKNLVEILSCADLGMALFAFVLVLFFISLISTSHVIILYHTTFIDLFIRVDYLGFYWHLVWI